jgi:hypothetical protein
VKPYYEESGTKIYNCDWRELSDDVLRGKRNTLRMGRIGYDKRYFNGRKYDIFT